MDQSLVHMFVDRVQKFGNATALLSKKNGRYREISWNDFSSFVRRFALGLSSLGLNSGDKVCLLSENRPKWAFSDLAILSLRAVNVPIYPSSGQKDIEHIVNHSEAVILIVSTIQQYEKVKDIKRNCPKLKYLIVMDKMVPMGTDILFFRGVSEKGKALEGDNPDLFDALYQEVKPEDLATIIYTSGTTGQPKGVMLTHGNFLSNVEASASALPAGRRDRCLSFLPLSHVFERMAGFYFMLYQGVSIAYAENMNTVTENLVEVRPTIVASVPRLYEKMHARVMDQVKSAGSIKRMLFDWSLAIGKKSSPYRLSGKAMPFLLGIQYQISKILVFKKIKAKLGGRLKYFISGGAPLAKDIAEFFFAADLLILEGYGLTETSPVVSVNRPDRFRFGTVGQLLPGVEVKIAEDSEILVRGANVMLGYFKNEEETKLTIRNGWFYTGDIGKFDEDGFLIITDRKKDLIKTSGGKYVAPQKIENLLVSDEYIAQVCVCGDRRNYITALIAPNFEQVEKYARSLGISYQSRQDLVRNQVIHDLIKQRIDLRTGDLANFEKIKYFTLLPEEFSQEKGELTPTLKLKRKVINEKYEFLIEAMYDGKTH